MCGVPVSPDVMDCHNCRTDVSFHVIAPDHARYGPYDFRHFSAYVADGSIPQDWRVVRGDADPRSVADMMQALGGAEAPPGP
jgi:hypothetical protein